MKEDLYLHPVLASGRAGSKSFACVEAFAVVAVNDLAGKVENSPLVPASSVARGVVLGGIPGIPYAQFARPGDSVSFSVLVDFSVLYVLTRSAMPPQFTFSDGAPAPGPAPINEPGSGSTQEIISATYSQGNRYYLVQFKSGGNIGLRAPEGYSGDYPQPNGSVYSLPAGWVKG